MTDNVYEKLAAVLDRLPNGFPRTPSNVELPMLEKIFAPDEAALAGHLQGEFESIETIANRTGEPVDEVKAKLIAMAKRGMVWLDRSTPVPTRGHPGFRLAPFIVGIYEGTLERMDAELARLFEEYMADGGAAGILKPQPALHRVIPVHRSVKSDQILPYEDVKGLILKGKAFSVRDCICRVQQDKLGNRRCDFPLANCMGLSFSERPPRPGDISQEQATAILEESEKAGLVHAVSNVIEDVGYICNCCGCCCGVLRGITDWGIEESVARANYFAVIDPDTCTACGLCTQRCQVKAIAQKDDVLTIDRPRCIGCGLCVTACPEQAIRLERKPDSQIVPPPVDFETWEKLRWAGRME